MLRDLFSLFPAYAGVILADEYLELAKKAFPRICGGDPAIRIMMEILENFSPHMRG